MKRLAWFGGSFNPVHNGHIEMAQRLLNHLNLDSISFLPARQNHGKNIIPAHHRLAMLRLALRGQTKIYIDEQELKRDGITYTIDTVQNLRKQFPKDQINFILGWDALVAITGWKNYQQLTDYTNLLVLERDSYQLPEEIKQWCHDLTIDQKQWHNSPSGGILLCPVGLYNCSSTKIRQALTQGKTNPEAQMPAQVIDYILQEKLYQHT